MLYGYTRTSAAPRVAKQALSMEFKGEARDHGTPEPGRRVGNLIESATATRCMASPNAWVAPSDQCRDRREEMGLLMSQADVCERYLAEFIARMKLPSAPASDARRDDPAGDACGTGMAREGRLKEGQQSASRAPAAEHQQRATSPHRIAFGSTSRATSGHLAGHRERQRRASVGGPGGDRGDSSRCWTCSARYSCCSAMARHMLRTSGSGDRSMRWRALWAFWRYCSVVGITRAGLARASCTPR